MNNVVLVHGGFVDGSGWESVYQERLPDPEGGRLRLPNALLPHRTGRQFSSATPMEER